MVDVLVQITGDGYVSSVNGGINCPTKCSARYVKRDATLTLTATSQRGAEFVGWSGACNSTDVVCRINTSRGAVVNAQFRTTETTDGPEVAKLVLMNTETGEPIPAFDPLLDGAVLDLGGLPEGKLTLIAVPADSSVQSIRFDVNDSNDYRTENVSPYALETDAGIEQLNPWKFDLGRQTVTATPYTQDGKGGQQGESKTVSFTLVKSSIVTDASAVSISSVINAGQPPAQTLNVSNTGNTGGKFTLSGMPNWLTVTPKSASVPAGESVAVSFQGQACTEIDAQTADLTFDIGLDNPRTLKVNRNCGSDLATFDYSLDRVYFNQAVPALDSNQSSRDQIPVIVNRKGIVRAFITSNDAKAAVPQVTLFYKDANGQTGKLDMFGPSSMPLKIDESKLNQTFNATLPASFFKTGREFYIEIDASDAIVETNELNNRYPASNYAPLRSVKPPAHRVTFVPVSLNGDAPNLTPDVVTRLYSATKNMHPIGDSDVQVRSQVYAYNNTAPGSGWSDLLQQMSNLARADGSNRYYHAIVSGRVDRSSTAGIGYVPGKAAVSMMFPETIAHEFGHNFSLNHVPCGVSGDPYYPHAGGNTNVYGYDALNNKLKAPNAKDFMSYCNNVWVSDYSYLKTLNYRGDTSKALYQRLDPNMVPKIQPTLIVNGFMKDENFNVTDLTQATVLSQIHARGQFVMRGFDAMGRELFAQPFDVQELSHSDDETFSIAIPNTGYENYVTKLTVTRKDSDQILFEKTRGNIARSSDLAQAAKAIRVGENIRITWDALIYDQATITDATTGDVVSFDRSGDIVLASQSDTFDIVLTAEFEKVKVSVKVE